MACNHSAVRLKPTPDGGRVLVCEVCDETMQAWPGRFGFDGDPDGGAVWAAALVLLCVVTGAALVLWVLL